MGQGQGWVKGRNGASGKRIGDLGCKLLIAMVCQSEALGLW